MQIGDIVAVRRTLRRLIPEDDSPTGEGAMVVTEGDGDQALASVDDVRPWDDDRWLELAAEVDGLRARLLEVQWVAFPYEGLSYCPVCSAQEDHGHALGCRLAITLGLQLAPDVEGQVIPDDVAGKLDQAGDVAD